MNYKIESTVYYDEWFDSMKDRTSKARIVTRLARVEQSNFGDYKRLTEDLFELRFTFGGGLRIYYTIRDSRVVLLLNGGNKSEQGKDIAKAQEILDELE
jgi:putative addiction module killer protein